MSENQALVVSQSERNIQVTQNYLDPAKFEHMVRVAKVFSNTELVPMHFRGKPESCFIALQMAFRLNIDPMLCLQNLYIVYGNPSMSAQLAISLSNRSGVFDGEIWFEQSGTGDALSVTAKAILSRSKREVSETVTLAQARVAGWTKQKDGAEKPFWRAKPEQMLKYRAATFLARLYAPEALMGMRTVEEWEDLGEGVEAPARSMPKALAAIVAQSKEESTDDPAQLPMSPEQPKRGRPKKEPIAPTNFNFQKNETTPIVDTPVANPVPATAAPLSGDEEVEV